MAILGNDVKIGCDFEVCKISELKDVFDNYLLMVGGSNNTCLLLAGKKPSI